MGETDRRPPARGPDSGHYEIASDRGGERAAAMYTLIGTAKLKGVDPQAWLADVLRRIADHPASRLHELLPWNYKLREIPAAAA
jgi:transposase